MTESAAEYVKKLDREYLMNYLKNHSQLSLQYHYQRKKGTKAYMETRIIRVPMDSGKINLEQVPFNLFDTAEEALEVIKRQAEKRGIQIICNGIKIKSHENR